MKVTCSILAALAAFLPLILPAQATLIVDGDFESFTANTPPPAISGYFTETTGDITTVSSTITDNSSLVIAGNQSWLFTLSADADVFDNEVGGYYTAVNASPFANLSPGTYQVTGQLRVLDPGFSVRFNFYYLGYDSSFNLTTNVSEASSFYASSDGLITWVSPSFTINPDNDNWYSGIQFQVSVGSSDVTDVQFVVDSLAVIPEPRVTGLLLVGAAFGLLLHRSRRKKSVLGQTIK